MNLTYTNDLEYIDKVKKFILILFIKKKGFRFGY